MSEPTCRACHAATLTDDERERFNAEPVTGCIYYCTEHEAVQAALLNRVDWSMVVYRKPGEPFDFATEPTS